jgi:hypothetical protein
MGRVNLVGEVGPSGSLSRSDGGSCCVVPLAATVGVLRGEDPVERLARRDGGSVIAVDADPTSDAEVWIESDEVLKDPSESSCEVPVLAARSRKGGFRGVVRDGGTVAPRNGSLRMSRLSPLEYVFSFPWLSSRVASWSLSGLVEGLRDRSG